MDLRAETLIPKLEERLCELTHEPLEIAGFRAAAVVVPLIKDSGRWELLFTVRSKQLSNHAGQISFPGGKVDPGESLEQAAIRELDEEVGLQVKQVLGALPSHPSPAKFVVTPMVAELDWPQKMAINPAEVDEVFMVPLDVLAEIEPRIENRTIREDTREIRFYDYRDRIIWGLTGNIIHDLLTLSQ